MLSWQTVSGIYLYIFLKLYVFFYYITVGWLSDLAYNHRLRIPAVTEVGVLLSADVAHMIDSYAQKNISKSNKQKQ